jgi:hypothetical protein
MAYEEPEGEEKRLSPVPAAGRGRASRARLSHEILVHVAEDGGSGRVAPKGPGEETSRDAGWQRSHASSSSGPTPSKKAMRT